MAVSLVSQPTTPNAAHTKLVYVVSGSGTTSNPQYSYVMDIYLSGSSERLNRLTQVPNPDGVAEFDASSTFISHQGYDNQWKCLISGSVNHGLPYRVHFGEQYGTSTSSSITVYPDLVTSSIQIFNGIVDPNYKYDIAKDSYNWGLNSSGNNFPSASFVQTRRGTPQTNWNQSSFLTNDPTKHFGRPRRAYPVYNESTSSAFQIPNVYKVVDKEDYETVSIFNNFSLPYDDGFGTVYTGSMNDTLLSGSLVSSVRVRCFRYPPNTPDIFDDAVSSVFYDFDGTLTQPDELSGSIPNYVTTVGVGPANLRDITFREINGGVTKYITGGEIFDSGSWLGYSVAVNTTAFSGSNIIGGGSNRCYFRNRNVPFGDAERAIFDMYIESISNDPSDVYNNYCNPKVRFAFINNYGVYDYYSIYSPILRTSDVEKKNVSLPNVDYSSAVSNYNLERRGAKSYYTDTNDNYTITTQIVDEHVAKWLNELLQSPEVFIQKGDDFIPVVITNSSYQAFTDKSRQKTYQYTIEFEASNGRPDVETPADPQEITVPFKDVTLTANFYNVDNYVNFNRVQYQISSLNAKGYYPYNINPNFPTSDSYPDSFTSSSFITGSDVLNFPVYSGSIDVQAYADGLAQDRGIAAYISSSWSGSVKVKRDIYLDGNLFETTSSIVTSITGSSNFPNPVSTGDLTFFLDSSSYFNLYYDDVQIDHTFSEFSNTPILSPNWYYRSFVVANEGNGWDDSYGSGPLIPKYTNTTRPFVGLTNNVTLGSYTGDFWEMNPETPTLPSLHNRPWTSYSISGAEGITGSNNTIQGWFWINDFSEINGSTPRTAFFTMNGTGEFSSNLPDGKCYSFGVGTRQSGSVNVLSLNARIKGQGTKEQKFPEKVIDTDTWYQVTYVKNGNYTDDITVYFDDDSTGYSMSSSYEVVYNAETGSQDIWLEWGTFNNDTVLSGSFANLIVYATSSLSTDQIAKNYQNINDYLLGY